MTVSVKAGGIHYVYGYKISTRVCGVCVCVCIHTRSQHNDRGDDQGTDDEDDQQSDGYPFPVPLRRRASHQVLKNKPRPPRVC